MIDKSNVKYARLCLINSNSCIDEINNSNSTEHIL